MRGLWHHRPMRHARAEDLDRLEDLLAAIRGLGGLKEKSRGVFYRKSQSFLHFHEDPAGLFADLRTGADFERFRVSTRPERARLLKRLAALMKGLDG